MGHVARMGMRHPYSVLLANPMERRYVRVLISLWLFSFAAQPKEFFLDGLKKLEQRSHKCVELRGGICKVNKFFFQSRSLLVIFLKPKTYRLPS
jgi:hypothetical protein